MIAAGAPVPRLELSRALDAANPQAIAAVLLTAAKQA